MGQVLVGGAFSGWFNVYSVEVRMTVLNFRSFVGIVGVPTVPAGFDGIACFKFLNRFHYGNFGNPGTFSLE